MRALALLGAALALAGAALAHSYLKAASPAADTRVRQRPTEVRLSFDEPIEARFSTFKVYRLEAPAEALSDFKRLRALAVTLFNQALKRKDDEEARADSGLKNTPRSTKEVVIGLKEGLKPGAYVVMWQLLSADSHVMSDFYVFVYQP
jgi:methionine-rich copper-binding protein CopC